MRSMTGFGEKRFQDENIDINVSVLGLNNRYFDLSLKMAEEFKYLESRIRKISKEMIQRGTITIRIDSFIEKNEILFNEKSFLNYLNIIKKAENISKKEISLEYLLNRKDVIFNKNKRDTYVENKVVSITKQAIYDFIKQSEIEGDKIKKMFSSSLFIIKKSLEIIENKFPTIKNTFLKRKKSEIKNFLKESSLNKEDYTSLFTEINKFIYKMDINEEKERLHYHVDRFEELIETKRISLGKELNFILQELQREITTLGAKCSDISIIDEVIKIKLEIEKSREMAQNIV